jgi:hypothetical protein
MTSESNLRGMEQVIDELTEALSGADRDKINKDSKMDREDTGVAHADSASNPFSIHFSPKSDAENQIFSIAKWLQRRIVWRCGYVCDTILKWCNANAAEPASQNDDDGDDDDDDNDDNDDDDDDVHGI